MKLSFKFKHKGFWSHRQITKSNILWRTKSCRKCECEWSGSASIDATQRKKEVMRIGVLNKDIFLLILPIRVRLQVWDVSLTTGMWTQYLAFPFLNINILIDVGGDEYAVKILSIDPIIKLAGSYYWPSCPSVLLTSCSANSVSLTVPQPHPWCGKMPLSCALMFAFIRCQSPCQ